MAPQCFYSHVTEIKVTFPEFASGENSVEVSQAEGGGGNLQLETPDSKETSF